MTEQARKLAASQARIWQAVKKVLVYDINFTGQLELEINCQDGVVKKVYEKNRRRQV